MILQIVPELSQKNFLSSRTAQELLELFLCFVVIVVVIVINVAVGIFTTETPKQSKFNKIELQHFENSTTCQILN